MSWAAEQAQSVLDSLDGAFRGNGIVVAVAAIDAAGAVVAASDGASADGHFEIGSVTKTMTATLLACLVGDGTVALSSGTDGRRGDRPHGPQTRPIITAGVSPAAHAGI